MNQTTRPEKAVTDATITLVAVLPLPFFVADYSTAQQAPHWHNHFGNPPRNICFHFSIASAWEPARASSRASITFPAS
jgi:hypothetical protein